MKERRWQLWFGGLVGFTTLVLGLMLVRPRPGLAVEGPVNLTPHPDHRPRPAAYPPPWAPTLGEHFLLGRAFPPVHADIPLPDSRYGFRLPSGGVHTGIDLPAPAGTPVLALADGVVVRVERGVAEGQVHGGTPYGVYVLLRHDRGWQGYRLYTLYAHLERAVVRRGDRLRRGQVLGYVGKTGQATGPHLHLEVRFAQEERPEPFQTLNPELWMAPYVNWGALVGQVRNTWGYLLQNRRVFLIPQEWEPQTHDLWHGYRTLRLRTYTFGPSITRDPLYNENFAIGNLPAGRYRLVVEYGKALMDTEIYIRPGRVTFFVFRGMEGFTLGPVTLMRTPEPPVQP